MEKINIIKMNNIYDFLEDKNFHTIIECGGHLGKDTVRMCNIFSNANIYCIEANNYLCDKLKLINIKNLKIFNYALSTENKDVSFFLDCNKDGDMGASSLLQSNDFFLKNHIKNEQEIVVKGITLSEFMKLNNIDTIDFLWMDIEGYEYYVLNSSIEILKNIKYIYTEVNFQEFRKNMKLYEDIKKLMNDNNFEEINKWTQGDVWGKWQGNVLFRNKTQILEKI